MIGKVIFLQLIIFGGIFITSKRFMNVENDAKTYFIGVLLILFLLVCSFSRKGLPRFIAALSTTYVGIGFSIVCFILSTYGLLQYSGYIPSRHYAFPITGTYENPAGFAAVQAALFPFALYLCFRNEYKCWIRWFAGVTAVLCFVSVLLSGSRAGVLAICAAAMVVLVLRTKVLSVFKTHRWLWLPLILTIVIASVVMYRIKASSADGRLFVWSICLDMIKERPLFGYGIGGIEKHYMDAQAAYFNVHPDSPYVMMADNVTHPFNEYIKLLLTMGWLGLQWHYLYLP